MFTEDEIKIIREALMFFLYHYYRAGSNISEDKLNVIKSVEAKTNWAAIK